MYPAPHITNQHLTPEDNIPGNSEIEMSSTSTSNNHRQSGGDGIRGWFSGRDERGRSLRESFGSSSGSGSESGPKSPVQEMSRIEAVLTDVPLHSSASDSRRNSRRNISGPSSPLPTLLESESSIPVQSPNPAAWTPSRRESQQAMAEISHSVRQLQAGNLQETRIMDVEAQSTRPTQRRPVRRQKKWWWQKPRWKGLQNRLVTSVIAGIMCTMLLAIYLGMALTPALHLRQEWHFLMILIILVMTLFFCHSLVRICIDLTAYERARRGSGGSFSRVPSIAGPHGYAVPREPIRINTQNPDMEGLKEPPPVYGLWRCSVRVNPNEFYWVKRQSAGATATSPTSPVTGRRYQTRPPSYISDDGVSYVVNAVPEIRAPEPSLPPHPSEVRRLD